jgi:hypothetical protein
MPPTCRMNILTTLFSVWFFFWHQYFFSDIKIVFKLDYLFRLVMSSLLFWLFIHAAPLTTAVVVIIWVGLFTVCVSVLLGIMVARKWFVCDAFWYFQLFYLRWCMVFPTVLFTMLHDSRSSSRANHCDISRRHSEMFEWITSVILTSKWHLIWRNVVMDVGGAENWLTNCSCCNIRLSAEFRACCSSVVGYAIALY